MVVNHHKPPAHERGQIDSQWPQHHREEMCQANQYLGPSVGLAHDAERRPVQQLPYFGDLCGIHGGQVGSFLRRASNTQLIS